MVTVSKQAKLALTAIVLIFIIAVIFLAFNFKQASAAEVCSGEPRPCSEYTDPFTCELIGCEYDAGACGGTPPACAIYELADYCTNAGCSWITDIIDNDDDGYASDVDCIDSIQDCADKYSGTIEEDICSQEMANINPGAEEVCDDNLDNDCDNLIDENDPACIDEDSDGYNTEIDCIDSDADCEEEYTGEPDLIDACKAGKSNINPDANENCFDHLDNDCNGMTDEYDPGCAAVQCTPGEKAICGPDTEEGECEFGEQVCRTDGTWGNCIGAKPPEAETIAAGTCDDDLDNDCDSKIDLDDEDCEEPCTLNKIRFCGPDTNIGACEYGEQVCQQDRTWGLCEGAVYPANELCNQEDDDCDRIIDNLHNETSIEDTQCACYNGADPEAMENTTNKIDDDCDGEMAEEEADADGDGYAIFEGDCDDEDADRSPDTVEKCIGNIDEDCDGDPYNGCNQSIDVMPLHAVCGDGICEATEASTTCCADCGCLSGLVCVGNECVVGSASSAVCGDGVCESARGETKEICPEDCESKALLYGGVLGAILAMIALAGWWFFYYKPQGELAGLTEKHHVSEPSAVPTQSLSSYIHKCLSLGYGPGQVKQALLSAGWDTEVVNESLAGVHGDLTALGTKAKPKKSAKKTTKRKKK